MITTKAFYCRQTNCMYIAAVTPDGNVLRTIPFTTDISDFKATRIKSIALSLVRQVLQEYVGKKTNFSFNIVNSYEEVQCQ